MHTQIRNAGMNLFSMGKLSQQPQRNNNQVYLPWTKFAFLWDWNDLHSYQFSTAHRVVQQFKGLERDFLESDNGGNASFPLEKQSNNF